MPANYVLLGRFELNASAASVTFNNIPQSGYTDLKIVMSGRGNGTSFSTQPWQNCSITLNGTSNTSAKQLYGTAAGAGSDSQGSGIWITDPEASSNTFSNNEIYLPNYLSSAAKSITVDNVTENYGADAAIVLWSALFSTVTSAVTTITITPVSGSFLQYSTFSIYGLAAKGTSPIIAPKATGGNITTDGTYWIHTFNTSGTFTPLQALACDYLVVAGGGAGGYDCGGGGGAGGYLTSIGGSKLSVSTQAYPITIGAGGSPTTNRGTSGSNSVFSSITATGGGGGGSRTATFYTGADGGSGGGGGGDNLGAGGSASPAGQGNAGGRGLAGTTPGGGGGGANAAGSNTTSEASAGFGGSGKANTITGTSVNYAGGGGGGYNADDNGGAGGGGYGGGASSANPNRAAQAGTANKGGGGGGGSNSSNQVFGANGGSGIVIIRYART